MKKIFGWLKSPFKIVTIKDLIKLEQKIMSVISDYAAIQTAFNNRLGLAVDGAVVAIEGLTGDIKKLNDKITELQNSPGGVTPEDQALINDLQAQGIAMVNRVEALTEALKALDAMTPPAIPVG